MHAAIARLKANNKAELLYLSIDMRSLLRRQLLIILPWASFVTVILIAQRQRTRNGEKREEELPAKKRRVWTDAGTFVDQ